MNESMTDTLSE
jgi:hypothetical protein